jgi:hypothetical protein
MRRPRLGCLALTLAIVAFLTLVITGVMKGAIFQAVLTPAAQAEPATATSQCQPLPQAAATSPSPSPSPSASTTAGVTQLCVSVQAGQATIKAGQTATWTIAVSAQGGSIPAVTISLTAAPAGTSPVFTATCPSGSGTASCDLGDLATPLTPASYALRAQVTVPASATGALVLTAAADAATSPAMAAYPAAGQAITITTQEPATKPAATPSRITAAATPPAQQVPTYVPPPRPASDPATISEPTLGALPAYTVTTPTATAGSIASVLPVMVPGTTPAVPAPVASSPVADIMNVPGPSSSAPQAGTFTLTIGMSARTAEILGIVILALAIVLAATRIAATRLSPNRRRTRGYPCPVGWWRR